MTKNILTPILFSCLFFYSGLYSQVPEGYYTDAEGLEGEYLKTALYNIIKGHTEFSYTSSSTDVWDILKATDRDPDNPNNVILFYTGESKSGSLEYNNEQGWNREHVWAKARGNFGTARGAGTDVHALRACNIRANSDRSNRWFANSTTPHLINGEPTGCFYDNENFTWQPRSEEKGDVARMIFYMAVRYEGKYGEPDLEIVDYFPEQSSIEPIFALLSDLLIWHEEDPVSDRERTRNDIIYYDYQGNRNPFIDNPEYAQLIWGDNSTSSIPLHELDSERELVKIVDMTGREVEYQPNTLLLFMYSDGTVEKKIGK